MHFSHLYIIINYYYYYYYTFLINSITYNIQHIGYDSDIDNRNYWLKVLSIIHYMYVLLL